MLQSYLFVMGIVVGSFLNVVIDRLSLNKSLLGRSHCDHCRKTLQPMDLVPVFSFLVLRGKCRSCGHRLSIQYPIIEMITGMLFVTIWSYFELKGPFVQVSMIGAFCSLLVLLMSDLKYRILADEVQIALFLSVTAYHLSTGSDFTELARFGVDGFIVLAPLLLIFILSRGKGMGFGDVKLAFIIGYWFGFVGGLTTLYLSFVSGGILGIILLALRKARLKQAIAFGPFLIVSMIVFFVFKGPITAYLNTIFGLK